MNLTQCVRGHYYDLDKYDSCPFCSGSNGIDRGGETMPAYGNPSGYYPDDEPTSAFTPDDMNNIDVTIPEWVHQDAEASAGSGEKAEPLNVDQEDDEKTVGFINWNAAKENERMSGEGAVISKDAQRLETANPVVGWLVCTSGSNYGQSFTIHGGRNFIGRDIHKNDIGLPGDDSISRVKHAVVVYDAKHRQFFAQPGEETHELFYLNEQSVLSATLLKDRDVITLGRTTLVFVPFCDENFGWNIDKQGE